jgi:hypothetical protein
MKRADNKTVTWEELMRLVLECGEADPAATRDLLRQHWESLYGTRKVARRKAAESNRVIRRRRVSKK